MYPLPDLLKPTVKAQMEAQLSLLDEMSTSFLRSVQLLSLLNMQMARTMTEEYTRSVQGFLNVKQPASLLAASEVLMQPMLQKIMAYQQSLSRIAIDSQSELARAAAQQMPQTSRSNALPGARSNVRNVEVNVEEGSTNAGASTPDNTRKNGILH